MRSFRLGSICAVLILAASSPSKADVISVLPSGILSPPHASSTSTFDDISQTAYGQTSPAGRFSEGGVSFAGGGIVMKNGRDGSGGDLGLYAEPYHDTSNYLVILGNENETISYNSMRKNFGLYWGSIDSYNYIIFFEGDKRLASYTGADVTALDPIPFGDQKSDNSNRYVEFNMSNYFDKVILGSGVNAFELDNITSDVPEPKSWVMIILGFVILLGIGRQKCRCALS